MSITETRLILVRDLAITFGDPPPTHGTMRLPDGTLLHTLELPWRDNQPNVSCIPEGEYWCAPEQRHNRPSYRIHDVPGRSGVLIHTGNFLTDTSGCILPGCDFVPGKPAVYGSSNAMLAISTAAPAGFWLRIQATADSETEEQQ